MPEQQWRSWHWGALGGMQKARRAPAKGLGLDFKGLGNIPQLMCECDSGMDSTGFQPWLAGTGSQNFYKCLPLAPSALLLPSNAPTCHTRDHMGQQCEKSMSLSLSCPSCQVLPPQCTFQLLVQAVHRSRIASNHCLKGISHILMLPVLWKLS